MSTGDDLMAHSGHDDERAGDVHHGAIGVSGFLGMDTTSGRQAASRLESGGQRLPTILGGLEARVLDPGIWRGPDADAFRERWTSVRLQAETASASLIDRGRELAGHAEDQDAASGENGDPAVGGHLVQVADRAFPEAPAMFAGPLALGTSDDPDGSDGLDNDNRDEDGPDPATTDHTLTQEDADRILHEYQVESDEVTTWELSGIKRTLAELAGADIPDPIKVTRREAELLDGLGLVPMRDFRDNSDLATNETSARYGDENGKDPDPEARPFNDDHADAFRHAYVNALTSRDIGEEWATAYWTAHERLPNNDSAREAMDLYNNEVGRRIAAENPDASDKQLADLVQQAVADGEMVVIDESGRLVPSNSITPEQAGQPDPNAPELPGHPQQETGS